MKNIKKSHKSKLSYMKKSIIFKSLGCTPIHQQVFFKYYVQKGVQVTNHHFLSPTHHHEIDASASNSQDDIVPVP